MHPSQLFNILQSVDSTNNYAMGVIRDGLAQPGMAWFAYDQFNGRGQRNKQWKSKPGENLILTVLLHPPGVAIDKPFQLSAAIALEIIELLNKVTGKVFCIKWPNDIYYGDRKAGGILIENIWAGNDWKWAVVGIGINVNQVNFDEELLNPISLKLITREDVPTEEIARKLHKNILYNLNDRLAGHDLLEKYNLALFKKNEPVLFSSANDRFVAVVKGVNSAGSLLLEEFPEREFRFGELVWELKS